MLYITLPDDISIWSGGCVNVHATKHLHHSDILCFLTYLLKRTITIMTKAHERKYIIRGTNVSICNL